MSIFGRKKNETTTPPVSTTSAVLVAPRRLRSVPFTFDTSAAPAVNEGKISLAKPVGLSLKKSHEAAKVALLAVELPGIRFEVIVLMDGSGSTAREYERRSGGQSLMGLMLVRTLGFALNVDVDGSIPIIVYGSRVDEPIDINLGNFENTENLIRPDFTLTNMAGAFKKALAMAELSDKLTLIVNITDGNPYAPPSDNAKLTMDEMIRSAGMPVMIKNLAIRQVDFLDEIDNLPSKYQIRKDKDGKSILDGAGRLVVDINPAATRLIDNVDSKDIEPRTISDEDFAKAMADEIAECLEMMARVGLLTGVPGIDQEFEL